MSPERQVMRPYGVRLADVGARRGALCVGIDPHPELLRRWGLEVDAAGLERCARSMVEAVGESVAVLKPQSAFFEAYGSAGIAVLERVLADIRAAGALSILDVKRGDIGSTMDAYAAAYLGDKSPLVADAITLSPYLGFGSLRGAIDLAAATARGVYVLALTSNPEGPQIQHAVTATGARVAETVITAAAELNAATPDVPGHVGVVVGATIGRTGIDFGGLNGSILAPGIGAQGAGASDLVHVFGSALPLVLPSVSREVMSAGPTADALREAVARTLADVVAATALG